MVMRLRMTVFILLPPVDMMCTFTVYHFKLWLYQPYMWKKALLIFYPDFIDSTFRRWLQVHHTYDLFSTPIIIEMFYYVIVLNLNRINLLRHSCLSFIIKLSHGGDLKELPYFQTTLILQPWQILYNFRFQLLCALPLPFR